MRPRDNSCFGFHISPFQLHPQPRCERGEGHAKVLTHRENPSPWTFAVSVGKWTVKVRLKKIWPKMFCLRWQPCCCQVVPQSVGPQFSAVAPCSMAWLFSAQEAVRQANARHWKKWSTCQFFWCSLAGRHGLERSTHFLTRDICRTIFISGSKC